MNRRRPTSHQRSPINRRRLLLVTLVTISVLGVAGVYAWRQPVVAAVEYRPCEISYGQVVGEWDGGGDAAWDDARYHYQLRSFRISAQAPAVNRPNVIEAAPKRLATGGEQACRDDFDEQIKPGTSEYRWLGAQATAVGLVRPAGVDTDFQLKTAFSAGEGLKTLVSEANDRSVAWVDDGGQATLLGGDRQRTLMCANYGKCGDITEQRADGRPQRGTGFVPLAGICGSDDCAEEANREIDLSKAIGRTPVGLKPFSLRLAAVSTYAPGVGTEILLTFAYPKMALASFEVANDTATYKSGQALGIQGQLRKPGPTAERVELVFKTDEQPLKGEKNYTLNDRQLARLNETGQLDFKYNKLSLAQASATGQCYELPLTVRTTRDGAVNETAAQYRYCMASPMIIYTYQVASRGAAGGLGQFAALAAETLADNRGWAAAEVAFTRVESGGDFTLWLSAPAQMPSFSSGCDATYSCRVGSSVIINEARWDGATPSWNQAGGSLRDYRHMVVNHEVGHFLGLGHSNCPASGAPAPVMMQQSISLGSCRFNPWPLASEIAGL